MKFLSVLIFLKISLAKHVTRGPPTTPEEHPCQDHEHDCIAWSHHGECESNPGYMLEHCAYSCGVCKGPDKPCEDHHDSCEYWASVGECEINPGYMMSYCRLSCSLC